MIGQSPRLFLYYCTVVRNRERGEKSLYDRGVAKVNVKLSQSRLRSENVVEGCAVHVTGPPLCGASTARRR